jgi:hypothetical protein
MSELSRLMVKAIRSLPQEEQDALLEAMLEPRLAPFPEPGAAPVSTWELPGGAPGTRVYERPPRMTLGVSMPPLGPETGGPWQSVPVRLSTDQHERLKQWCQDHGFTMAVVLRGLVARFLDDQAVRRPRTPEAPPPAGEPEAGPVSP